MEDSTNGSSSEAILWRWQGGDLSPLHHLPLAPLQGGVLHDLSAIQVIVVIAAHNNENLYISDIIYKPLHGSKRRI